MERQAAFRTLWGCFKSEVKVRNASERITNLVVVGEGTATTSVELGHRLLSSLARKPVSRRTHPGPAKEAHFQMGEADWI